MTAAACDPDPALRPGGLAEGELGNLIGGFYAAALGDEAWTEALMRLSAWTGGEGVTLNHCSRAGQPGALLSVGVDPSFLAPYNAYYRHISPFVAGGPPSDDGVSTDRMLMPRDALERTEYFSDFLAPHGLHHLLSLTTADNAGRAVHIALWRTRRRGVWDEREIRQLRCLRPHLQRALALQSRIAVRPAGVPAPTDGRLALTWRERECLVRLAHGATSKIAARDLGLSVLTVDDYIASAMAKLGAVTRAQAVAVAFTRGLLDR
jgi:DNA-binding CsgD family transcriptional regulator